MSSSKRWLLMKLVLEQTDVVLKKMHTAMDRNPNTKNSPLPLSLQGITKEEVKLAQQYVSDLVGNDNALKQASQDEEFANLVDELQSAEMRITRSEIEALDDYESEGGRGFWSFFKRG